MYKSTDFVTESNNTVLLFKTFYVCVTRYIMGKYKSKLPRYIGACGKLGYCIVRVDVTRFNRNLL